MALLPALAGVTPACRFYKRTELFLLGYYAGFCIILRNLFLKEHLKIDDALDVSSVHGVTGIIGSLAIGVIASTVINPAGPEGFLYGNPMQLGIQAIGVAVAAVLGFVGTIVIMKIINATMGLKVKEEEEDIGLDITQHAERAYVD